MQHAETPDVLVGLIGTGIQASRTPRMHMREGGEHGLRYVYTLIDLEQLGFAPAVLPSLLDAAQRSGFAGLNITHPCKQAVIPLLDELSPDARDLGAVNTVVFREGRRIGHNTDWFGFAQGFRNAMAGVATGSVLQLGAGGAGSAVAHAAMTLGFGRLGIHDVDRAKATQVVDGLRRRFGDERAHVVEDVAAAVAAADGLINATPIGMASHPGLPLPEELLRPDLWVAEIVYFPLETALLRTARALGCRTVDGGGMAVFQAVEAFRLFTGIAPDAMRMQRHFASM